MDDRRLDPDAPLPGPPDPWAETDMPSPRDGPPWHMTEMIEAEPALAARIFERLAADGSAARLADEVRAHADAGRPIVVVGCGTSEHGAQAVAALLREGLTVGGDWTGPGGQPRPISVQAYEASLDLSLGLHQALVIAVSHEGATWATMQALESVQHSGGTTALITASRRSPAATETDIVLETGELDQSWCHTVGYVSPIVAGIAVEAAILAAHPTETVDPIDQKDVRSALEAGLTPEAVAAADVLAGNLAACERIIVIGRGVDQVAARELTLKIEEGTHIPAAMRDVETLLHGHLAGMDAQTGVIAIGAGDMFTMFEEGSRLVQALRALPPIGVRAGAILTTDADGDFADNVPDDLTPAGRIVVSTRMGSLGPTARALLSTAVPLQLLTERIARVRGVNPDPIRRDDRRYLAAAEASSPTS